MVERNPEYKKKKKEKRKSAFPSPCTVMLLLSVKMKNLRAFFVSNLLSGISEQFF